jgi:RHS repeat-associated protein
MVSGQINKTKFAIKQTEGLCNSQLSHTAYTYDLVGNITQAVSSYPWLPGQTFTENFAYDSTNQLVSAANAQTYALSVTYGDWGRIQQYGLQQTDLANNVTTSQTRYYSYGSLNEGQTTFAPNNISYADGTNVNEQYGINGSLLRRETTIPNAQPNEELYRFGADGNLRLYSYDRLFFALYGYDGGTTRTYKYSFDLNPQWVNGRLEAVNFNLHNAMFYPNAYINFNSNGYYTKHYYNGMERIASRLGDQALPINVNAPDLQDRKDWQDSLIRKNVAEITGYDFLPVGEEQNPDDPKPVFELPQVGIAGLQPSADGIYYYHSNHLGSTCYVTDENAIVQQGFLYAPFGEITNEHNSSFGSSVIPKYSFNAKELDEETGMYYYEARYMAPPVFISRDPLFEKYPTFTPYAYCANNPVKYVDPDGREYGNFYDENGKLIGTDGTYDNQHYVIRNGENSPFSDDDLSIARGFVVNNNGNTEAFKNNLSVYDKFIKIVTIDMLKEAYSTIEDDGRGGRNSKNNMEYGGYANEDGTAWEETEKKSKVGNLKVDKELLIPGLKTGRIKYHSHASGTLRTNLINTDPWSGVSLKNGETTSGNAWEQKPSERDKENAGETTNYVFGMGDGFLYIYNSSGIQAKISTKGLLSN